LGTNENALKYLMKASEFVGYFNLIKPSFEEVAKSTSSVSPDIATEVFTWYDLRLTSTEFYDDEIIDVIENTNISELPFSSIQLLKAISHNSIVRIGNIEEKGDLYFDRISNRIMFEEMYEDMYNDAKYFISQSDFLSFLKVPRVIFRQSL
jgi:hypothetical protein